MSIATLSREVAAMLAAPANDKFAMFDLTDAILKAHDQIRDAVLRETLRSWIGKLQAHYGY